MKVGLIILAAYLVFGFLTFGWVYNHTENTYWTTSSGEKIATGAREIGATFNGALWPIYWVGKTALAVTVWP